MIALVYAQSTNGVIGRDNDLPWHLPLDLQHFKQLTMGHTIVMGRKTYESIGRALPERRSIVITAQTDFVAPGCDVVHSWDQAVTASAEDASVFVIGGSSVYRTALPDARTIHRTLVHAHVEGDVTLDLDTSEWRIVEEERHEADDRHAYPFTFQTLERATPSPEV